MITDDEFEQLLFLVHAGGEEIRYRIISSFPAPHGTVSVHAREGRLVIKKVVLLHVCDIFHRYDSTGSISSQKQTLYCSSIPCSKIDPLIDAADKHWLGIASSRAEAENVFYDAAKKR